MNRRNLLLTPGPLTTSAAVKRAAAADDECPREPEFGALVTAVGSKLRRIAGMSREEFAAVLLGGPGTAAVEAAIGSLVPVTGRLLVLANGAYGRRGALIARRLGIATDEWEIDWTERPGLAEWSRRIESSGCTHAFWVHHETTVGLLNPLEEMATACRAAGVTVLVDAMSSFGGVELAWGELPVDAVITSANKCLQGLPGVGVVLVRREVLAATRGAARSVALDLHEHQRMQEDEGQFPFTPPVPIVRALEVALDETLVEGVAVRAARYRANHAIIVDGLRDRGLEPLVRDAWQSRLLTAFGEPAWAGFSFAGLHGFLRRRGITIYPGKLPDRASLRIGHIGAITPDDQREVLAAIDDWRATLKPGGRT